ncbi:sulfatase-like hydrolase/transferase [Blastopirellula marina]|uniref:N-acetylgalactosamine-4-sulfatase n=2 Tax=Blastopirellula marina TaxID=124 RepID=A0A2S8FWK1_9BACT|nr:sulfatase-like hydrolase/transferase [Blastopirellula marina]PQO36557.1 N-acetylgalactosamine-4-sulfatase [Blastopirellula marina]PQO47447.1 N-acetylgalactosamine-4-sulfatase [Blastopirellula marina]PTL44396.1 N-acetylgalactosamine-4-sulfatase [Blastopirellula marina]
MRSSNLRSAILCTLLTLTGVATFVQADEADQSRPPNVLLLVADDLGYSELGCMGNRQVRTPHLDRFAGKSLLCRQAYVAAPNCSPSRAGFLTGRFPTRFGYEFNPIGARNEDPGTGLPSQQKTLSEYLHDVGYTTGLIGKWHLGGAADYHPLRHGFDEFFGFLHEGHYFVPSPWEGTTTWLRRRGLPAGSGSRYQINDRLIYSSHMGHDEPAYDADNPILRGGQPVVENEYLTDAITRESVSFIKRYQGHPWFLYVAYNAVHSPLQAKEETLKQFADVEDIQRRIFLAMLADLDKSVGAILQAVTDAGEMDNTLIVFLSDNGGPTRETTASNLPLRAGKGSMYEGGIRIPMILHWPGHTQPGTSTENVASSLDLYATVVELIGRPAPFPLDGVSWSQALSDAPPQRQLYWRQGKRAALRQGNWKIITDNGHESATNWELYDLANDPSEKLNLAGAAEHQQRRETLLRVWQDLNGEMAEPLF